MFDAVRNNKRIVQIFLLLITLPFAFWGVDSYVKNAGSGGELASVGGTPVSQLDFQQAMREQQERLRTAMGENFNPAMLETVEARKAVLDNLINQRLLALDAAQRRLSVSDQQMRETIAGIPAFQENGQFSLPRYEAVLKAQGMGQPTFETRLRNDLALKQVVAAVAEGTIVSGASAERVFAVQFEERQVSEVRLGAQQYAASVKLADGAAQKFYDTNRSRFEIPAQVRVEYLVLSQEALAGQLTLSDADLRKEYDAHPERFRQGEERRVSHILIQARKDAGEAELKAAREKIEGLLVKVKASPADFAKLAKENSQDPGSAERGGDLGFFGRGAMVKPFEEAAFGLAKEGDVSGVVQSDFGFHIIKLAGVKAEQVRPFEDVRNELAAELKKAEAGRKFAELAEGFTNMVYEQADSLKPAAEKYKLTVQTSGWFARNGKAPAPFDNEKLVAAVFSDDSLKNKRNTDAVDVGKGVLVAARVLESKPAALRPFDEVRADIEKMLVQEEAAVLAEKDGEKKLAQLAKGDAVPLEWGASRPVKRMEQGFPPEILRTIFRAPADKLPSYAGAKLPGMGYVVFRVEKITRPTAAGADDPRLQAIKQQYARLQAEQDFAAYLSTLRKRHGVTVNAAMLESTKDK